MSQAQRRAAKEWYDHTLYSRLNDKLSEHEDDLAGHVMAQEDWDVVRLPAIAEADEVHRVETVIQTKVAVASHSDMPGSPSMRRP